MLCVSHILWCIVGGDVINDDKATARLERGKDRCIKFRDVDRTHKGVVEIVVVL